MSTIVDWQIRELCRSSGLVEPFDVEMVNPASIDVTLGDQIKVENDHGEFTDVNIKSQDFYMPPGGFVLAHTAEFVRIPNNFECVFQLKSSRGREGYEHALAGYIDAGFHGKITLELSNLAALKSYHYELGCELGSCVFLV